MPWQAYLRSRGGNSSEYVSIPRGERLPRTGASYSADLPEVLLRAASTPLAYLVI